MNYEQYPFVNEPLPYAYDAMEPYIDQKTMQLHHDKHLQTYIDNLNHILAGYPQLQGLTVEQLLFDIASLPEEIQTGVRNNAGGVYSHRLYFSCLKNPAEQEPSGMLLDAICQSFGSMSAFRQRWKETGLSVFGSGYVWLVVNAFGQLAITTTANQDTPLPLGLCPVLNMDVWEHAYYLKNYNVRANYIDNWFHVVNWKQVEQFYRWCLGLEE